MPSRRCSGDITGNASWERGALLLVRSDMTQEIRDRGSDYGERGKKSVALRPATRQDSHRLWEWWNDPIVRASSFNKHYIPFEVHQVWLSKRLDDPATLILIIVLEGLEIGYVRFTIKGQEAEISVALERAYRGRGYGSAAIHLACRQLLHELGLRQIRALIKAGNSTSIAAFERAGFKHCGTTVVEGVETVIMTLTQGANISE